MAKSVFDGASLGIPCPACGHKTQQGIGSLQRQSKVTCGGCGREIEIVDKGFREGIEKVDKALAKLKSDLGKAFK